MNSREGGRLGLVTHFVCILMIALALAGTQLRANVTSIVDLTPDQLVGPWEALEQRQGMVGSSIYQMTFFSPKEAWLVKADPASDPGHVQFLGRLVSEGLANGQIKLEFTRVHGQSESDYVSIQIE